MDSRGKGRNDQIDLFYITIKKYFMKPIVGNRSSLIFAVEKLQHT